MDTFPRKVIGSLNPVPDAVSGRVGRAAPLVTVSRDDRR